MLPAAIHSFLDQEYNGPLSLCIDDDSDEPWLPCDCVSHAMIGSSIANWSAEPLPNRWIGYEWQRFVRNCAIKRNAIVESMLGAIDDEAMFAQWDDDDLHGPARIRRQVEALLAAPAAELCVLDECVVYDPRRPIVAMASGLDFDGTSMFRAAYWKRERWDEQISVGSGSTRFVSQLTAAPATIVRIRAETDYVVIRHGANHCGEPSASYRGGPWKKPPLCSVADLDARIRSSGACRAPRCR